MPDSHVKFHSSGAKRMVLVVDDEAINRYILGNILEEHYDVIYAATGAEALSQTRLHKDSLSVILLDLILPDINGLQILRELKDDPELSLIPVIVMSADTGSEVECLSIGAMDFISKPYPPPQVIQARVLRIIELSEDRDIIKWTERDHLTGLYTQEYFFRYAAQYDQHHKELPMDAMILDINHFHVINERYGKAYGDEVLKRVAERVRDIVKSSDGIVCRRGADTFLVYCPHRTDYAEIIDNASLGLAGESGKESRIRLRMGVYSEVDKTIDIERRFDHAKTAADSVRGAFNKAIGIYDSKLHDAEMYDEQLLEGFEDALREKQFQVYYQPKYDVRPDVPVLSSAEALVRWMHPVMGMISPGQFIPLFESNGLIERLDQYVWRETAAQIRDWKERLDITVPVSVNMSRVDMYDSNLVSNLLQLLDDHQIQADELLLEITESAYTQNSVQIIETVNKLREVGFRIEMDDFGTGYSSLNMISSLPIDALKLDMQFVRNAFSERKDTRMLEVIIEIAGILSVPTIAEGVETAEQMFTLKSMGCDIVQGYYFSRPVPAKDFERFLIERKQMEIVTTSPETSYSPGNRPVVYGSTNKGTVQDRFTYDALHDPVTGLYNGSAFEVLLKDADQDHIALLIMDVDGFDALEENCTRNMTDRIAIHIADVLRQNFRSVDYICRIRKDEYVVIITRVVSSQHLLVEEKVSTLNEQLQAPAHDIPPITLTVGAAFSDRENPSGDIFQDADTALMRIKNSQNKKKTACEIY